MVIDLLDEPDAQEEAEAQAERTDGREEAGDNLAVGKHFQHGQHAAPAPVKDAHGEKDVKEHLQAKGDKVGNEPE